LGGDGAWVVNKQSTTLVYIHEASHTYIRWYTYMYVHVHMYT
jgi:hypothetical protein